MDILVSILIVFIAGFLELWLAIPLGFVLGLPPLAIAVLSALGSIAAAFLITLAGEKLRSRFLKWRYGTEENLHHSRIFRVWNRYGVIGLGLLSPLLFGSPLGTAIGIVLGAQKKWLLLWMTLGIIIWSAGLTAAVFLGVITLNPQF